MNILLGPPGTGKTTKLLSIMDEALSSGVKAENICFISFTKRAIKEARERVSSKFNLSLEDIDNFRTLHSFAFKYMGMRKDMIMQPKHYQELSDVLGIELKLPNDPDDEFSIGSSTATGDRLIFYDGLARNSCLTMEQTWEIWGREDMNYEDVLRVQEGIFLYKMKYDLYDYTSLIEKYVQEAPVIPFDLLLVDEAQDLSTLQWKMVEQLVSHSKRAYIAGDDDQAIFRWAGADVNKFISLKGDVTVLDHSYRLPKEVLEYAREILNNISYRRKKDFNPAGHAGSVQYVDDFEQLDMSEGTWLILARSSYTLIQASGYARLCGYFFHFQNRGPDSSSYYKAIKAYLIRQKTGFYNKKEFYDVGRLMSGEYIEGQDWTQALDKMPIEKAMWYKSAMEAGQDMFAVPRIQFSTIHGAKGAEADNVVLFPDLTQQAYEACHTTEDEHRVLYVAVTRAKKNLYLMTPRRKYSYAV